MILLIHLLLSSVSVECTSCDSFVHLFRNYVYYPFLFPKIDKRGGVLIRAGGLENFSKINKREGDDYSVLESSHCNPYLTFDVQQSLMHYPSVFNHL